MQIPFNKITATGREQHYLQEAVNKGFAGEKSDFVARCRRVMQMHLATDKIWLTNSCSAALEVAALLSGARQGHEVIMPAYTFPSTANPFLRQGADIRFLDSRRGNPAMEEKKIEELITERTRVIVAVHYGGMPCDIDAVKTIAQKHGLLVVEDAAQGYGASIDGKSLGTIGDIGCISFHSTKNIQCHEGGALVINNESLAGRVDTILDKGTNREEFINGRVNHYEWKGYGSGYRLSELHAAMLLAQLEDEKRIRETRVRLWNNYLERLAFLEELKLATLPVVTAGSEHNGHIFHMVLKSREEKEELKAYLLSKGIRVVEHYKALNDSAFWKGFGKDSGGCSSAKAISETLVRLPLFDSLTESEQNHVIKTVVEYFARK